VRKVRQAGARYGGREPSLHEENPWGSGSWVLRGVQLERTGGAVEKGDAFQQVMKVGEPGRPTTSREHAVPPRRKTSGEHLGTRLLSGVKPLKHRVKAGDGFGQKCKSGC
jgi:hypothetical protein